MTNIPEFTLSNSLKERAQQFQSLLVVNSSPFPGRTFKKQFGKYFGSVFTASTADHAEEILEKATVSHLVISNRIASGISTRDLVAQWKFLFKSITRVVLFIGANTNDIEFSPEIDAVVTKPASVESLRDALLGQFPD